MKNNLVTNLIINIVIPVIILTRFTEHLGAVYGLVLALLFPFLYGLYDFIKNKNVNVFSVLGIISVPLTAGIGLLQLDPKLIAIKESAIPLIIGLAILISTKTKYPIVKKILYNEKIMNIDKINGLLKSKNDMDKKLFNASIIVSISFFLSALLNYTFASLIVVSNPGTEAFNQELGYLTAISFPAIALPSMVVFVIALFYIVRSIKKLTGLKAEEIFNI